MGYKIKSVIESSDFITLNHMAHMIEYQPVDRLLNDLTIQVVNDKTDEVIFSVKASEFHDHQLYKEIMNSIKNDERK